MTEADWRYLRDQLLNEASAAANESRKLDIKSPMWPIHSGNAYHLMALSRVCDGMAEFKKDSK